MAKVMDPIPKLSLAGRVLKCTELVDYREGLVVSREIMNKANGKVTLFAFDKGEGLSEHTSPFDAMVQVVEGEAEITISRHPHRVKAGEFIIMPANQPHALKAIERYKMILTMLRG